MIQKLQNDAEIYSKLNLVTSLWVSLSQKWSKHRETLDSGLILTPWVFRVVDLYQCAAILIFSHSNQSIQTEAWRGDSLVPFSTMNISIYCYIYIRGHDQDGGSMTMLNRCYFVQTSVPYIFKYTICWFLTECKWDKARYNLPVDCT